MRPSTRLMTPLHAMPCPPEACRPAAALQVLHASSSNRVAGAARLNANLTVTTTTAGEKWLFGGWVMASCHG